ncbi:DNA pilot protein [Microviridae sp.]|nr:DNA pilot protein [Microviridae sp.]
MWGGLISAGANLAGSIFGIRETRKQNKDSKNFSREMYDRQHKDNVAFWNKQNEYNDPSSQMKRLQAANLNPNLIYGNGAGGASGQASPIKTPDVQSAQFKTPDFSGIGQAGESLIQKFYDIEIKKAQIDNLKADNTVKLEDALLKKSTRENTQSRTDRNKFDLQFESGLAKTSADIRRENLRKTKIQADKTLNDDERAAALTGATLKESVERVLNYRIKRAATKSQIEKLKSQISNLNKDYQLKKLNIEMIELGINPSDPTYMRILGRLFTGKGYENVIKDIWNGDY